MKLNRIISTSIAAVFTFTSFLFFLPQDINAANAADFKPGRIIDDGVFYNANSMNASQIQQFLNSKVPTCDTNGQQNSEFGGPDLNGDGKVQRWEWGKANYNQQKFICLRNYSQSTPAMGAASGLCNAIGSGNKSAATIIYDVAKACGINPQVLIILLQKEQSLITDTWPLNIQYQSATGFDCPDTAPCDPAYAGFFYQVYHAARQFKVYQKYPEDYNYIAGRTNNIYWHPDLARCGSSQVYIENQATAALYIYTPYRPNQAALNNLYGTGDSCSSYGNRNFWRMFTDWFGSTRFPQPNGGALYRLPDGRIYLVANSKKFYIASPSVLSNYNLNGYGTVSTTSETLNTFTDGGNLSNLIRDSTGKIYLIDGGYRYHVPSPAICTAWGFSCFDSNIVKNLGDNFSLIHLKAGQNLTTVAKTGGTYYLLEEGKRKPFANAASVTSSGYSTSTAANLSSSNLNQDLSSLIITTPGIVRFSPKTTLYYFDGSSYYSIANMSVYDAWRLGSNATHISVPESSYNTTTDPTSTELGYFYSQGDIKYAVDNGSKIPLSAEQLELFPSAQFVTAPKNIPSKLSNGKIGEFIKVGIDFLKINLDTSTRNYIASMIDYVELGGKSSNTTTMSSGLASQIPLGPYAFADGRLIKIQGKTTIYVYNDGDLYPVASMDVLKAYGFNTSNMKIYPESAVLDYTIKDTLRESKHPNGTLLLPYNGTVATLSPSQQTSYGLKDVSIPTLTSKTLSNSNNKPASEFWRNTENGSMYYAKNGKMTYIDNLDMYHALGGGSQPLTQSNSYYLNLFEQ